MIGGCEMHHFYMIKNSHFDYLKILQLLHLLKRIVSWFIEIEIILPVFSAGFKCDGFTSVDSVFGRSCSCQFSNTELCQTDKRK